MTLTLLCGPWAPVSSQAAEIIVDVECTSSVKSSFPPNAGQQPVVDTYAPCTSSDSTLKSGTRRLASSLLDLCNIALTESPGKDEIVWNNGTVSIWEYRREVSLTYGSIMIHQTGKITAGAFLGDSATEYLGIVIPGFFLSIGAAGDGGSNGCETAEGDTHTFATGKLQIIRS